jgi:hypothetical protein
VVAKTYGFSESMGFKGGFYYSQLVGGSGFCKIQLWVMGEIWVMKAMGYEGVNCI